MTPASLFQQLLCTGPHYWRRHPGRYALSVLSIGAAVALFVSMRVSQASIVASFQANRQALAGGAEWIITRPGGLDAAALSALEAIPGLRAAPIVQGSALLGDRRRTVMVVGIDPVRDPALRRYDAAPGLRLDLPTLLTVADSVIVPARLADANGWTLRQRIVLVSPRGERAYAIAGLLYVEGPAAALDGNIVFMPIAAAQRFLDRSGRFDRIEVSSDPPIEAQRVRALLPEGALVRAAGGDDPTFESVYRQFQMILVCITLLACVIGAFIVYNAVSRSVVERTRLLATLRALGALPSEAVAVFLIEAAVLGLVASVLGVVGGRALADEALRRAAEALSIMVQLGGVRRVLPPDALLAAPLVGMVVAVIGAWIPARAAARLPPVEAMQAGAVEARLRRGQFAALLLSGGLFAAALVLVRHPRTDWPATVLGVLIGMVGIALAGPSFVAWTAPLLRRWAGPFSNVPLHLALENVVRFPARSALTVFAFGGSLSIVVAFSGMLRALDGELRRWMRDVLVFDLTLQANDLAYSAYPTAALPAALLDDVRAVPGVAEAYGVVLEPIPFRGEQIMLIAYDAEAVQRGRIARGVADDPDSARRRAAAMKAGAIEVSRNLARIHGLRVGDTIGLPTADGARDFEIGHLLADYTWFRGSVFMDLDVFRRLWGDPRLSYVDVRVQPGTDVETCRAELTRRLADRAGVFIYGLNEIRDYALKFMNAWLEIGTAQLFVAVLIGGIGVANTLFISLLTQTRQIGLLRAVGASTRQLQAMLAAEAGLLAGLSGLLGCAMGLGVMLLFATPLAVKTTGIELPPTLPAGTMAACLVAAGLIAAGAAVLPLRMLRRVDVVAAIGYE